MSSAERLLTRSSTTQSGLESALFFALVAERLHNHYEYAQWLKDGQARQLAREWLARATVVVEAARLKAIVAGSGDLARQIAASLSREAGLYTAHEMMECLDPNHQSELGQALMAQCGACVEALESGGEPE